MHPQRRDQRRAAVFVVAGVVDKLCVQRIINAAPSMKVVITLQDVLACIVQIAVAKQKAQATEAKVVLVIALDRVGYEGNADLVVRTRERAAEIVSTKSNRLIDLGVCVRFMLSLVPADSQEATKIYQIRGLKWNDTPI